MMNKQAATMQWDHFRQLNGIAMRAIAAIPADKIDSHPVPKMRTPKELVVHTYGMVVKNMIEGIPSGEVHKLEEEEVCGTLKTRDDLSRYATDCWKAAERALGATTDAHLTKMVKTPFGADFPGHALLGATYDEFLHHRGQLYTYLRALGVEPPMMWDFEHNAPEYRPKAQQPA